MPGLIAGPRQAGRRIVTNGALTNQHRLSDVRLAFRVKDTFPPKPAADFQHKSVADELAFLRKTFRDLASAYATEIEGEITSVMIAVKTDSESKKKLPASRAHDLRDMLSLLRNLDVRPAKGRRRDLKKLENAVEELRRVVDGWG